jgi:hypothetical protein
MREPQELFPTHDGVELFYRRWPAEADRRAARSCCSTAATSTAPDGASRRRARPARFRFYAWDARGHGRSPGAVATARASTPRCATWRPSSPHRAPRRHRRRRIWPSSRRASARCWSRPGRTTTRRRSAHGARLAGLQGEALRALRAAGLALMHKLRGNFFVNSYVKARFLTHDPERIASYDADPLITRDLGQHPARPLRDRRTGGGRCPRDHRPDAAADLRRRLGGASRSRSTGSSRTSAAVKERHILPASSTTRLARRTANVASPMRAVPAGAAFRAAGDRAALLDADRAGYTRDEADRLRAPLPRCRRAASTGRRRASACARRPLVGGHRARPRTGFDSGSTLDYVYRNQARGAAGSARLIDRQYLDSIGWRGIRQRKLMSRS